MPKTVVIVEDMGIVREGVRALLGGCPGYRIAGEASDGIEALQVVERCAPDVVLMDIGMPRMDGADAIREIKRRFPRTKVIALTAHNKSALIFRTLHAGADGYMLKTGNCETLVGAIQTVLEGRRYISPDISQSLIDSLAGSDPMDFANPIDTISVREKQVLKLIARGMGNKEIAAELCISHKTVEKHKASLKRKLRVNSNAEMATLSMEYGLLEP
ncbi:two component transcriptional regulator, LuxR family [Oleidesulfovibrio alaskensis G20]|jgi:DNA-binding NarL/FixJ family response regulator|uniref:Two component transcriptional regulator, LuxR family n=1 Tax=Oleidesulfovibrio alaskensis (strain ATCC BAA-1058 / DSM 17464 / G20) TaxID=207559 RepID=Q30XX6_OLEA2|nr:response regulator transcription factor [Oleidesulfovibrio alaskensis]ABB39470.1 two component transcriptional regulator, LuxR family [Oleidesulfovibrio alaskensis G20]MBG0772457.1 response regulator transcription factor [Oleidesulfovibrio alaskensis]